MVGEILDGKYRIVRPIGSGGMGTVYEATHEGTGRRVAVKVVNGSDNEKKDELLIARFQREARAAGAIESQHIGQVLDTGTHPGTGMPFLVMEFLQGDDLQTILLRHGPLTPEVTLRITAQACLGLRKAHEAGIIHRDIKPANIFLTRTDDDRVVVKLLDFGIAKIREEGAINRETGGLTRTGSMIGSPLYMSPEQARGAKVLDARADVWSMGVVMFEALTNRTPYQDIDALGELILAICSQVPPIVQDYAPWVSKEVAAIVHRCLAIPADQRYASVAELSSAIKAHLPNGLELTTELLTPIEETARSQVAPRLKVDEAFALSNVMAPAGRASLASVPGASQPGLAGAAQTGGTLLIESDSGAVPGTSQPGAGGTHNGVTKGNSGGKGGKTVLFSALAIALLGGGLAAYAIIPPSDSGQARSGTSPEDGDDDAEADPDSSADEESSATPAVETAEIPPVSETETAADAETGSDTSVETSTASGPATGGWKPPPPPPATETGAPPPPPPDSGVDISGFGD